MKKFAIYCKDEESLQQARDFYRKMFENNIIKDCNTIIETNIGIAIQFIIGDIIDTCGCRLEDFLVVADKKQEKVYEQLHICTLG